MRIFDSDIAEGISKCSPIVPGTSGLGLSCTCYIPVVLSVGFLALAFSLGFKSPGLVTEPVTYHHCFSLFLFLLLSVGTEHSVSCETKKETLHLPRARER